MMMMMSLSQSKTFDDTRACFFDSFRFFFSLGFGPNDVNDDDERGLYHQIFTTTTKKDGRGKQQQHQSAMSLYSTVFILRRKSKTHRRCVFFFLVVDLFSLNTPCGVKNENRIN